ncbi:MAG: c-type cytochrome, partial [Sulfurovaceae bacterium]|nr:c-type cytochrome [Sulfurovaceae bacterium]
VALLTIAIIALMVKTYMEGGAYHGGKQNKVIKDIGTKTASSSAQSKEKDNQNKEMDEQFTRLQEKAGNIGAFKVSQAYKSKCSSCHGVNGSGMQNGKKLMGPKLFGQSSEEIYQKLADFKSGRKENMIMKGLLIKLSDEDLHAFANEIGQFPARAKALESKSE